MASKRPREDSPGDQSRNVRNNFGSKTPKALTHRKHSTEAIEDPMGDSNIIHWLQIADSSASRAAILAQDRKLIQQKVEQQKQNVQSSKRMAREFQERATSLLSEKQKQLGLIDEDIRECTRHKKQAFVGIQTIFDNQQKRNEDLVLEMKDTFRKEVEELRKSLVDELAQKMQPTKMQDQLNDLTKAQKDTSAELKRLETESNQCTEFQAQMRVELEGMGEDVTEARKIGTKCSETVANMDKSAKTNDVSIATTDEYAQVLGRLDEVESGFQDHAAHWDEFNSQSKTRFEKSESEIRGLLEEHRLSRDQITSLDLRLKQQTDGSECLSQQTKKDIDETKKSLEALNSSILNKIHYNRDLIKKLEVKQQHLEKGNSDRYTALENSRRNSNENASISSQQAQEFALVNITLNAYKIQVDRLQGDMTALTSRMNEWQIYMQMIDGLSETVRSLQEAYNNIQTENLVKGVSIILQKWPLFGQIKTRLQRIEADMQEVQGTSQQNTDLSNNSAAKVQAIEQNISSLKNSLNDCSEQITQQNELTSSRLQEKCNLLETSVQQKIDNATRIINDPQINEAILKAPSLAKEIKNKLEIFQKDVETYVSEQAEAAFNAYKEEAATIREIISKQEKLEKSLKSLR